MPLGLPAPGQVGGPWGGTFFPQWFNDIAIQSGWDMLTAANEFANFIANEQQTMGGGPLADLGWYWNQFRPGGALHSQPFVENQHNLTYEGQTVPNAPVNPPPGDGGGPPVGGGPPGSGGPPLGSGGDPTTPPPRPTSPPAGAGAGQWKLMGNGNYGYRWEWVPRTVRPDTPAAPTNPTQPSTVYPKPGVGTGDPSDPPVNPQEADPWSRSTVAPSPLAAGMPAPPANSLFQAGQGMRSGNTRPTGTPPIYVDPNARRPQTQTQTPPFNPNTGKPVPSGSNPQKPTPPGPRPPVGKPDPRPSNPFPKRKPSGGGSGGMFGSPW